MKNPMEGGYTGGLTEAELFGEVKAKYFDMHKIPETKELIENENLRKENFISFKKALDYVKDAQLGDPTNPAPAFARGLRIVVGSEGLKLEDKTKLKFYTAVSPVSGYTTHADFFHRIDAFLELENKNGNIVIPINVTQDLKLKGIQVGPNQHVAEDKNTIIFEWPREGLDPSDPKEKKEYLDRIREVGRLVVDKIKQMGYSA